MIINSEIGTEISKFFQNGKHSVASSLARPGKPKGPDGLSNSRSSHTYFTLAGEKYAATIMSIDSVIWNHAMAGLSIGTVLKVRAD